MSTKDLVEEWLRLDKVPFLFLRALRTNSTLQEEQTRNEIECLWKENNIEQLENRLR